MVCVEEQRKHPSAASPSEPRLTPPAPPALARQPTPKKKTHSEPFHARAHTYLWKVVKDAASDSRTDERIYSVKLTYLYLTNANTNTRAVELP